METEIRIRITNRMTDEDWRRLTTWREHVFSPEGLGTDWVGGKMHILASAFGKAVGHIGFDVYTLIIDGEEHKCIGVGAVVVIPEYQGQHLPARMFERLREWRDENHSDIPLALFCPASLVSYYRRHNFTECMQDVFYLQKSDYHESKFKFMTDRPIHAKDSIYIPSNPW
jgi:GNAT superfamily N-acetyltransferase